MQRLLRLSLFLVLIGIIAVSNTFAQPQAYVSGRVAPGDVRVFVKDTIYIINRDYVIGGTLIIEPGTTVKFYPNGRLIDSVGGRIIADGLANATYNPNPGGLDPSATPGSPQNPYGWDGYSDLNYFVFNGVVNPGTIRDLTINSAKYDYMFGVILNKNTRRFSNYPEVPLPLGPNQVLVPFEYAIMFTAARLFNDPDNDVNLRIRPWTRYFGRSVNVTSGKIQFVGQPENNFSREWGHIVILPGARAAFFRNCTFEGFRKDVTVGDKPFYSPNLGSPWTELNETLAKLTNGTGGAITSLSSRLWLIDVEFKNNMARHRGGALALLQAPDGYPIDPIISTLPNYPADKNPNYVERDGSISSVLQNYPIPAFDLIDESAVEPLTGDQRQSIDDGRLALLLGRIRNVKFVQNFVQLANVKTRYIGNLPVVQDAFDEPADYPQAYGNVAFGGAIYIAGRNDQYGQDHRIEIGLGINNSIKTSSGIITFPNEDTFEASGNYASNYQNNGNTYGARGGAIYVGSNTSLIVAGKFVSNETYVKYLQDSITGTNSGYFSRGGAIYCENTFGRLQVKGGPRRDLINNATIFQNNKSGSGGAIFVDGNTDPEMSPIIGGSEVTPITRDYGYNIKFLGNTATAFGGAIYSARNLAIVGAGGVEANALIGYGGNYPVIFENNKAGFGGGAIEIHIAQGSGLVPPQQRAVELRRVQFINNTVGEEVADINKPFIRGGGAIYSIAADLNVVKGVQFIGNKVYNGNGGAIAMVNPEFNTKRYFVTDVDNVLVDPLTLMAVSYTPTNEPFTYRALYPPDTRMMTQFLDNEVIVDESILQSQSGSGTTQIEKGTSGTVAKLYDVAFYDMTGGFAVGQGGTIIKITQGGDRWEYQNYSQPYRLMSITFKGTNGFIAGDRGVILKTDNNGTTWREVHPAIFSYVLNDIFFPTNTVGYAVGSQGMILKSTDAGENWTQVGLGVTNNNLYAVYFVSATRGFAVGDRGTIIVTTDGGNTWDVRFANTFAQLKDVYFTDMLTGYAVGHWGVVLKTTNGGDTWEKIYENPAYSFNKIIFTSLTNGYLFGEYGLAWKTTDAGANWSQLDIGSPYSVYGAIFPSSQWGVISGDYGLLKRTLDGGSTWTDIKPADIRYVDIVRKNWDTDLPENGVGLGGAIYILDVIDDNRANRVDSIIFNRVRIQNNKAYTGAAVYSDNYNLRLVFNRSLITGNEAYSMIGYDQNVITGPVLRDNNRNIIANAASSDLAGAILYGEIVGPLPSDSYHEAANSIYNNKARFLIRLPDAPNSKGVLAGRNAGFGGTDTLRGNYWGRTEANLVLEVSYLYGSGSKAQFETFFVDSDFNPKNETYLKFMYPATGDPREQGPFESMHKYSYIPIPNENGSDESTPGQFSIPEKVLMSGLVYDLYDKGTDIKVADYSNRRMVPIEDFAVGIPPTLRTFDVPGYPSFGKYVKRWLRDPFVAEARDENGQLKYPFIAAMQDEFRPDENGEYYHPIGYPLFLEAQANYDGLAERSNHDPRLLNETVFFVINETTGDYVRVALKQVDENAPYREIFRARVELVPDSTNRNPNTTIRRTEEGLYNLGTGSYLLQQLRFNPEKEDRGALQGRKYHTGTTQFAKVPNLFSNRPSMPPSNQGNQTFFAGERYRALPVDTGDIVRVVSRTVLWKEGEIPAYDRGISFKIVGSTEPPVFTGNVVKLQTDTVVKIVPSEYPSRAGLTDTLKLVEFLNTVFLTEDREYPAYPGTYSSLAPEEGQGRDSIISVTAMDTNNYFDPRSYLFPNEYSQLTYHWNVDQTTGLARWLLVDTIHAGDQTVVNPKDNALGYIVFRGRPINPYVVPGGEYVSVRAENYPPMFRVIDSLKALGVSQDTIDKFIYIFAPYLSAYSYDIQNARYLQQDTILNGSNYYTDYSFRIFVVDSTPRFMNWVSTPEEAEANAETLYKRIDRAGTNVVPYVIYKPSVYTCGMTNDNRLKANLTNKLRFQVDFNTDDELEDAAAANPTLNPLGWDFRFGRTAYGFMNIAIRGGDWWGSQGDTVVIDTTIYDQNFDGNKNESVITQTRPVWMSNQYLMKYATDGTPDPFGVDVTTYGQINIRIDSALAWDLLKPTQQVQYNGALNTDTVFTLVVNDGHGGINFVTMPVFINVAPIILTDALPPAKEDIDYNPQLIDSTKMIKIYDPNFNQSHWFELIYSDYPDNQIPKDPCFPEAGSFDITNLKTTPKWLKINPVSGLLYGKPGIKDAPKTEQVVVAVWDLVDGEKQLSALKVLTLFVDSTNHKPRITSAPKVVCVDQGQPYSDTLLVWDYDLKRGNQPGDPTEELTLRVIQPATGFTVEPAVIRGTLQNDTVKVVIKTDAFNAPKDPDGKVTIRVEVRDANGAADTLIFRVKVSDQTDFLCTLLVENTFPGNIPGDRKSAWQELQFGTAPRNATTGEGLDGEPVGTLDQDFCEYELPSIPPIDVFDARWTIPLTNGTLRNIFPRAKNVPDIRVWKGRFQAGGEVGNTSINYPVSISWNKDEIPDKNDAQKNPTGGQFFIRDGKSNGNVFNYNMKTGEGYPIDGDIKIIDEGARWRVQINRDGVTDFLILFDWLSEVDQPSTGLTFGISGVSPNPVTTNAKVYFGVRQDGRIRIELIDALGNVIATIVDRFYPAGQYVENFSIEKTAASGVYFIRMTSGMNSSNYPINVVK